MKKIMLFIAALFLFCIVSTATTQAIPQKVPDEVTVVSNPPNAIRSVFNQEDPHGLVAELGSTAFKDNGLKGGIQDQRGTTIAQSGTSTTTTSTGKANPHVMRRGRGRSTMGDNVTEKDSGDKGDEIEDDEEFGDDSAVDYNRGLKNSSGYNEDL